MERIPKNIKRFLLFWSIVVVIVLFAQVVLS